jgi:hypothetical protein
MVAGNLRGSITFVTAISCAVGAVMDNLGSTRAREIAGVFRNMRNCSNAE